MTHSSISFRAAADRPAENNAVRLLLAAAGAAAMVWAVCVFPKFSSEMAIVSVAKAVLAGELFKPGVLAAVDVNVENDPDRMARSSVLGKIAIIHLRYAEDAIRTGDTAQIDRRMKSLTSIVDSSLRNAPSDPFLWLARFWLNNIVLGYQPKHLRDLRMSYDIGRYEGWLAAKRNRLSLAYYRVMPLDLAEMATAEFVGLVRWGLHEEAVEIAAGPGLPLRSILFPRLKDLSFDSRLLFAQGLYKRELDDVLVPGIAPPKAPFSMPVMPPGF